MSHQIFLPLSMQWVLTSRSTKVSYSAQLAKTSGMLVRGKRSNTLQRYDLNPVFMPFWMGMNTGFKSYRCKVFERFPRTNIPDVFANWAEYETFVDLLVKTHCIDNGKKIWWDIRSHPFFHTLEVRVCDIPMRLDETLAIAALIQATMAMLYELHASNKSYRIYGRALIMENKFRASRYGIQGKLIDFGKEEEVPVRDLMLEYLNLIDPVVDELGSREEINYIHQMLEMGTGADRQLRVFEQTGDLKKVVDYIVAETRVGVFDQTAARK